MSAIGDTKNGRYYSIENNCSVLFFFFLEEIDDLELPVCNSSKEVVTEKILFPICFLHCQLMVKVSK